MKNEYVKIFHTLNNKQSIIRWSGLPFGKLAKTKQTEIVLRENRVKRNTDYAMLEKSGKVHIMCEEGWVAAITEAADAVGMKIDDWHVFW